MDLSSDNLLTAAAWDSRCFGFPVARIHVEGPWSPRVDVALACAAAQGFRLVYWTAPSAEPPPPATLDRFHGALVDRKVTWRRELTPADMSADLDVPVGLTLAEYDNASVCDELVELAYVAGTHSRFHVDPRFPAAAFRRLYRTWMERSVRREIAATVFVLTERSTVRIRALATVARDGDAGSIGLIAVDPALQGKGCGGLLLRAAHRYCAESGSARIFVTTQLDNRSACRLYERTGYVIDQLRYVYHFWPAWKKGRHEVDRLAPTGACGAAAGVSLLRK